MRKRGIFIILFIIVVSFKSYATSWPNDYTIVWSTSKNGNNDLYMFNSTLQGQAVQCFSTQSETQVTNALWFEYEPAVYNNIIVWEYSRPAVFSVIEMCDMSLNNNPGGCLPGDFKTRVHGTTLSPVDTNLWPSIHGNIITWSRRPPGGTTTYEIYRCDLSRNGITGGCLATDIKDVVTSNSADDILSIVYNNIIVWVSRVDGNDNIYMCDISRNGITGGCLSSDQKTRVTSELAFQSYPDVGNNIIVWQDNRNGNVDIYMCDISRNGITGGCLDTDAKSQVTSSPSDEEKPVVYNNIIVWTENSSVIRMCDISKNNNPGGCLAGDSKDTIANGDSPDIYGNAITFGSFPGLAMCDLTLNGQTGGCLQGDAKMIINDNLALVPAIYGIPGSYGTCPLPPPACELTSIDLTGNCAAGLNSHCEIGETVTVTANFVNDCSAATNLQVDASGPTGSCDIRYSDIPPGSVEILQSINFNSITIQPTDTTKTFAWQITSIPASCQGITMSPIDAALYNGGPPGTGTWIDGANDAGDTLSGGFTFSGLPVTGSSTTTTTSTGSSTTSTTLGGSSGPGLCGDGIKNYGEQCDTNIFPDNTPNPDCIAIGSQLCDNQGFYTDNIPCRCYELLNQPPGAETVIFSTGCQDDGNGDSKGIRTETTRIIQAGSVISETSQNIDCDLPPLDIPFFSFVNIIIAALIISVYYSVKRSS